jgi:hypothetical protein
VCRAVVRFVLGPSTWAPDAFTITKAPLPARVRPCERADQAIRADCDDCTEYASGKAAQSMVIFNVGL